jgi:DNA mismatch endonuclease, patch repair protein
MWSGAAGRLNSKEVAPAKVPSRAHEIAKPEMSREDVNKAQAIRSQGAKSGHDVVSPRIRSRIMRAVGQEDTSAELRVRRMLNMLGLRYRVRNRDLPGSPDIANRSRGWAIFVNGCFWHGHKNCPKTKSGRAPRVPESNREYWEPKLSANRSRDARKIRELRERGLLVVLVWECRLRDPERVAGRLQRLLGDR